MLNQSYGFRLALAAGVGVLWALSFPLSGIAGLAWGVPGLLLAVTASRTAGESFRAGYIAGAAHYLISLSWLRFIPFPAGAYAAWFSLSLFLALFPPLWAWLCWRMAASLGILAPSPPSDEARWKVVADRLGAVPWWRLNLWFLLCAAAWVAWEMVQARLFGGFPWNLLGTSQYRLLPFIQIAAYTGVYGVTFLMVWFSVSLLTAALLLLRFPDRPMAWRRPLVVPALAMVVVSGGGFLSLLERPQTARKLVAALVQPSIPQTLIFDPSGTTNRFETLLRLTEQALATRPDVVIWPEASLPGGLSRQDFDQLVSRIREAKTWMIFGADEVIEDPREEGETEFRAFNSAFLLNPQGEIAASYRKQRLVMFGEYIPLVRWLPFLRHLSPIGDGFHSGSGPVAFPLGELGITTSVLICFEDNFPHGAREHADPSIDVMINLTNDAWFGESSAQWQHAANAAFRAIENGRPLIRSCNNGISCWIDAHGRLHSMRLSEGRDVYEAGFETLSVPIHPVRPTFYNRWGDIFGWTCVLAALIGSKPQDLRLAVHGRRRRSGLPSA
ncbi:MAG: apolipoprotein N-acyltransferase [Verrucomicrobiales bacterium]|nr:apolipoprotein N-acyltransferase [Verrucomicrobiales bacterium]